MIDLCIMLSGPLVGYLLPITLETMRRHDNLSDVNLHLVYQNPSYGAMEYILKQRDVHGAMIHQCVLHKRFKSDNSPNLGEAMELERDILDNITKGEQWMIDRCGICDWAFIMHFDIEFLGPWLAFLRSIINEDVGQVGDHACGLVGYRRSALHQCHVGFDSIAQTFLVKNHHGNWKIRHERDHRCSDRSIPISGWDGNELLEINLQHWGWRVITQTDDESHGWRIHNGTGSGRCVESVPFIRDRAIADAARLGIEIFP